MLAPETALAKRMERKGIGYKKGERVVTLAWGAKVEHWVWCLWCGELKKGDEAGELHVDACQGSCWACCAEARCGERCSVRGEDWIGREVEEQLMVQKARKKVKIVMRSRISFASIGIPRAPGDVRALTRSRSALTWCS